MPCWPTFEVRPSVVSLIAPNSWHVISSRKKGEGGGARLDGNNFNSPCNFLSTHCTVVLRRHVTSPPCLDQGKGQFDQIANRTCSSPSARCPWLGRFTPIGAMGDGAAVCCKNQHLPIISPRCGREPPDMHFQYR